ncbi:dnaA protein helix-turn-helix [Rhizobium sp. RU35A]|uniref:helix-turn-helix domain-containing protein n=1 Tax=Rhizobium sp. RU35A TaxID=1907414 RepID=UPI0009551D25|nr:helix-turn-helix domain-containing protein [Rhizobium sp. RU35A]SIP94859.1 dnaA protein helix-turn-helix [Rhizobium sp. RU35A]
MREIDRIPPLPCPSEARNAAGPVLVPPFVPPATLPLTQVCRIVRQLVSELVMAIGDRTSFRRDRRRALCHVRQIAMYVCHVTLSIPQGDIGDAFGRDRSTVGHACSVVEDRREDAAFDSFVSTIERMVVAVFGRREGLRHD